MDPFDTVKVFSSNPPPDLPGSDGMIQLFGATPPPDAWSTTFSFIFPLLAWIFTLSFAIGGIILGIAAFQYLRAQTRLALLQTRVLEESQKPFSDKTPPE